MMIHTIFAGARAAEPPKIQEQKVDQAGQGGWKNNPGDKYVPSVIFFVLSGPGAHLEVVVATYQKW